MNEDDSLLFLFLLMFKINKFFLVVRGDLSVSPKLPKKLKKNPNKLWRLNLTFFTYRLCSSRGNSILDLDRVKTICSVVSVFRHIF